MLFRLVSYRDPDLPQKPLNDVHDAADFVTVRVTRGSLGAPVAVEKGLQVRVHRITLFNIPGPERNLFEVRPGHFSFNKQPARWISRASARNLSGSS